jgi:OFA family oxalate/formate antiporter-like MFS transporter
MDAPRSLHILNLPSLRIHLARRCPFYYGWVVFAIAASTSYAARPLMSVAVLSVFMVPMTDAFGWSRGLFAGAVSLGGVCAVVISPLVGRLIDRYGSGWMISATSAVAGACAVGLSAISQTWAFYTLYVPGRMVFASPLELATSTAISNWFIRRRSFALALLGVTQGTGLALMPFVAQQFITAWGWRSAWTLLGLFTMATGIIPAVLLMARRPEDMSLEPDPSPTSSRQPEVVALQRAPDGRRTPDVHPRNERQFTLSQALHTRAFWMLAVFSATGFLVQAGVSLHQVGHYIRQGLPAPSAAIMASVFALAQVPGGLLWSAITRRIPVRFVLAISGICVALGAMGTALSGTLAWGILSATVIGSGVGGLHLLLRLAWADYYGRQHLGTIRGITLPVQIGGQAVGPVAAGFVFDATGSYHMVFLFFAGVVAFGSLLVLTAIPPRSMDRSMSAEADVTP